MLKTLDGEKIEKICLEIYEIFERVGVSGNEAAAVAGVIHSTACALMVKQELAQKEIIHEN